MTVSQEDFDNAEALSTISPEKSIEIYRKFIAQEESAGFCSLSFFSFSQHLLPLLSSSFSSFFFVYFSLLFFSSFSFFLFSLSCSSPFLSSLSFPFFFLLSFFRFSSTSPILSLIDEDSSRLKELSIVKLGELFRQQKSVFFSFVGRNFHFSGAGIKEDLPVFFVAEVKK